MYCWNRDSFMSNLLCFKLQLIFNFMTLIRVSMPFFVILVFDSRLRALHKASLSQFKFVVKPRQDYWNSWLWWIMFRVDNFYPVQYFTQIVKYVSYIWTVLCLCIFTSSNIYEIHMTAYFGYFGDKLHTLHNHFPSASYHLTSWRKQIFRFVSVIWVELSKVICD